MIQITKTSSSSRFQFLVSHTIVCSLQWEMVRLEPSSPTVSCCHHFIALRATRWDRIALLDTSTVLCTAVPQVSKPEFLDWAEVNFQCSCPLGTFMCVCTCTQQHALARSQTGKVNFWKILNVNLLRAKQSFLQIKAYSLFVLWRMPWLRALIEMCSDIFPVISSLKKIKPLNSS